MPTVYRLKDKNRALPNGVSVYDAATNYQAPAFASFTAQVAGVQAARIANPGFCSRYRVTSDYAECENFVDTYLGKVAFDKGWTDFYITCSGDAGGSPSNAPFPGRPQRGIANRVAAVAAGAKTIYEWIASKEGAVPRELADKRAETCIRCPLNKKGEWSHFFELASAQAVMAAMKQRADWNLTTPFDAQLGICDGCNCVNALSVHCPIGIKLKHIPQEAFDDLDAGCWVRSEKAALSNQ
jgi:hypothetical protein